MQSVIDINCIHVRIDICLNWLIDKQSILEGLMLHLFTCYSGKMWVIFSVHSVLKQQNVLSKFHKDAYFFLRPNMTLHFVYLSFDTDFVKYRKKSSFTIILLDVDNLGKLFTITAYMIFGNNTILQFTHNILHQNGSIVSKYTLKENHRIGKHQQQQHDLRYTAFIWLTLRFIHTSFIFHWSQNRHCCVLWNHM